MGETEGMVKIIADADTSEPLRFHILGAHTSDLIAEGDTGPIYGGRCWRDCVNTIHAHPTLAEAIAEAAEGVLGKPIHLARV